VPRTLRGVGDEAFHFDCAGPLVNCADGRHEFAQRPDEDQPEEVASAKRQAGGAVRWLICNWRLGRVWTVQFRPCARVKSKLYNLPVFRRKENTVLKYSSSACQAHCKYPHAIDIWSRTAAGNFWHWWRLDLRPRIVSCCPVVTVGLSIIYKNRYPVLLHIHKMILVRSIYHKVLLMFHETFFKLTCFPESTNLLVKARTPAGAFDRRQALSVTVCPTQYPVWLTTFPPSASPTLQVHWRPVPVDRSRHVTFCLSPPCVRPAVPRARVDWEDRPGCCLWTGKLR